MSLVVLFCLLICSCVFISQSFASECTFNGVDYSDLSVANDNYWNEDPYGNMVYFNPCAYLTTQ